MALIVACVLRSGGVYTHEWVTKLAHGVTTHLSAEHRFVCLTDHARLPVGERIALGDDLPGWWSKIELFRPGLFDPADSVLYLDLDMLVLDDLRELFCPNTNLRMVRDFLRGAGYHNSSVMSWRGDFSHIYRAFKQDPETWMQLYDRKRPGGRIGDQAFIENAVAPDRLRTFAPGKIVSYKVEARAGPPPGAALVAFHGRPKPPDAGGWAASMWESL